jgi:hypothetical protein
MDYTKSRIIYNGYQTLVMYNPFSTYSYIITIIENECDRLLVLAVAVVVVVTIPSRSLGTTISELVVVVVHYLNGQEEFYFVRGVAVRRIGA